MFRILLQERGSYVATIRLPAVPRKGEYIEHRGVEYRVEVVSYRTESTSIYVSGKKV